MNSTAEMDVLACLATDARRVVEIGVYEGSSAIVLSQALGSGSELHLVDPFLGGGSALQPGWRANPTATRLAVRRATRQDGPTIHWHMSRSQDVGRSWTVGTVDLIFIDGDHSHEACREDWEVWHPHVSRSGAVAFHDARAGRPDGAGSPGPTAVVNGLFRETMSDWLITHEEDTLVVVKRS